MSERTEIVHRNEPEDNGQPGRAVLVRPEGWAGRLICPPGVPMEQWQCVLPPMDERARRALCVNASLGVDVNIDKGAGEIVWTLAGVIAGWQHRDDPKRGPSDYSWLVLFDPDGRTLGSSSPILSHHIAAIIEAFPDICSRPLLVGLKYRNTKDGERSYHVARVLGEAPVIQE
jgi:hypothetical protein